MSALAERLGFVPGGTARTAAVEKTWRHGKGLGVAFGLALVAFACFAPFHPGVTLGLHLDGGTST